MREEFKFIYENDNTRIIKKIDYDLDLESLILEFEKFLHLTGLSDKTKNKNRGVNYE